MTFQTGSDDALVPLCGLLLRRRFPGEHVAPSWEWDLRALVPKSVRIPSWSWLVILDGQRLGGLFNLVIAYLLVCRVGRFDLRKTNHVLSLGVGFLLLSLMLAHGFGRFHGGL